MQKNKFVLDTNIWISAIITKSENDLKNYILKNNLQIFICKEMIFEIKDVLGRNKLKKYLNNSIEYYISFIDNICISNTSITHYDKAPDKDDNYLYDICLSTNSALVTGDKLLLDYKSDPIVLTITRNDFLNIYK